jgi:membrane protein DedA with SNARE-associated domain
MAETIQFLVQHGYILLFVWTLAEQIGLPLPAAEPLLIAAGALARAGRLSFGLALGLAIVACLISDTIWYEIGRRQGKKVLRFLCRISLEPDSCVRRTENVLTRHGARSLVIAKFVPGLSTAAPPIAGVLAMSPARFLLFDGLGSLLWAGVFAGLGYLFSNQLESVGRVALSMGWWLGVFLAGGLVAYLVFKYGFHFFSNVR